MARELLCTFTMRPTKRKEPNNTLKVPKKYQKYFGKLEREDGLIDDCPYMLYFAEGYAWAGEYPCMPVKSKKEALEFLRGGEPEVGYEEKKAQGLI